VLKSLGCVRRSHSNDYFVKCVIIKFSNYLRAMQTVKKATGQHSELSD
jgi:hypothetical protein